MAFLEVNIYSEVLKMQMSVNVLLPQRTRGCIGIYEGEVPATYPTLYLLHGMTDDHSTWMRRTTIETTAEQYGFAVVMPTTYLGWYTDMQFGFKYRTFIGEELPKIMRSLFPAMSKKREDTYVAGNSMGGYGALKMALTYPETFSTALCLSAAFDPHWLPNLKNMRYCTDIFGDFAKLDGSENDLFYLAERVKKSGGPVPTVWIWCGTEDFLIEYNRKMRDHLTALEYDVTYNETPGGHGWVCWEPQIRPMFWFIDERIAQREAQEAGEEK
jgi:putative tributyrin esterase